MKVSREKLFAEAEATGFRPEILEKVFHLLNLLEGFRSHPFLKGRLALKGGTALNLFVFDLPRLSSDIDLNYVGEADRKIMLEERPKLEQAIQAVCSREDLTVTRLPEDHAGGKWRLRYDSALGEGGNLEVDLNFMFRVLLWPVIPHDSRQVGSYRASQIPILDIHELAAGKLTALLARQTSRDLFDTHLLLTQQRLDRQRLRLAFVVYGAMNRKDWRTISPDDVGFEPKELQNHLVPTVSRRFLEYLGKTDKWATRLVEECRQALEVVLPFSESEAEFLNMILDYGEIKPGLLTSDEELATRIASHPWLQWKALNVRKHKQQQ